MPIKLRRLSWHNFEDRCCSDYAKYMQKVEVDAVLQSPITSKVRDKTARTQFDLYEEKSQNISNRTAHPCGVRFQQISI